MKLPQYTPAVSKDDAAVRERDGKAKQLKDENLCRSEEENAAITDPSWRQSTSQAEKGIKILHQV